MGCGQAKVAISEEEMKAYMHDVIVPESMSCSDWIAILVAVVVSAGPSLPCFIALGATWFPLLVGIQIYKCTRLSGPLARVPRDNVFRCCIPFLFLVALPFLLLTFVYVLYTWTLTLLLTLPIGICNCSRTVHSWKALKPFSGLPGDRGDDGSPKSPADHLAQLYGCVWSFSDLVCAVIGALARQGFSEVMLSIPLMVSIVPAYKLIHCNPFLFALEEVYINQWSAPLDTDGDGLANRADDKLIAETMKLLVCSTLLDERNLDTTDSWPFVGHHQFPPPERENKTVLGLQMGLGGQLNLVSHTTHPYDVKDHKPRSKFANYGIIIVHLQWWNPLYQFAGYVEVNARTDHGVEHPMWLILDPQSRIHMAACASVNRLFVVLGHHFRQYVMDQPSFIEGKRIAALESTTQGGHGGGAE